MKFLPRSFVSILVIFCAHVYGKAQTSPPPPPAMVDDSSKPESIIITKKNPTKEKLTVVIDGDNITINGKPVEDFKSGDITVTKNDLPYLADLDFNLSNDVAPRIAITPDDHEMMSLNDNLKSLHNQMRTRISTNSAFLGVMSEKSDQGVKITDVTKASAAEKAGLKTGDIITKINDMVIASPDDLYKTIGEHKPQDKVSITYVRNGKSSTTQAVLGKSNQMHVYSWNTPNGEFYKDYSPRNFSFSWNDDKPRLGITAQDTEDGNGVKVTGIDDDETSPASKAGLKEDDVITQVNAKAINSTDDLKQSLKDVKKGDTLKITFKRNNQTQTVDVKFPKELKTIDL